jgi:hypothetical protein
MTRYFTSSMIAVAVAGGLLAALPLSEGAHAITDTIFRYSTRQAGHYTLHNMAYASDGFNTNHRNTPHAGATSTSSSCALAAVHLPQGAKIRKVFVWATSTSAGSPTFELVRQSINGAVASIASAVFADTTGTRKLASIPVNAPNATVDNQHFLYGSRICVTSSSTFWGMRIDYTYTNAGD